MSERGNRYSRHSVEGSLVSSAFGCEMALTSWLSLSNQCVMSCPALSMMGLVSIPGGEMRDQALEEESQIRVGTLSASTEHPGVELLSVRLIICSMSHPDAGEGAVRGRRCLQTK